MDKQLSTSTLNKVKEVQEVIEALTGSEANIDSTIDILVDNYLKTLKSRLGVQINKTSKAVEKTVTKKTVGKKKTKSLPTTYKPGKISGPSISWDFINWNKLQDGQVHSFAIGSDIPKGSSAKFILSVRRQASTRGYSASIQRYSRYVRVQWTPREVK